MSEGTEYNIKSYDEKYSVRVVDVDTLRPSVHTPPTMDWPGHTLPVGWWHEAKRIATELDDMGVQFSHYRDPTAFGGTAYLNEGDIPSLLVEGLNADIKVIDVSAYLS
ncbi:unnamed protein product [Strongylus vulgaris]|uniref:Uncharacterized protein n=1 Tax=Strongylus vulgaris TaxID=40348 RepID=A0A3P7L5N1_STRVU|nr:unnamed protein product [Strongylus vulgaris]